MNWLRRLFFRAGSLALFTLFATSPVRGQITPDNTLGAERKVVTPNTVINGIRSAVRIDGRAIQGTNLFHSFQDFYVDEGLGVYFSNTAGVEKHLFPITVATSSFVFCSVQRRK